MNLKILAILFLTTGLALFLFAPYPKQTNGFRNISEIIYDLSRKNELAQPENFDDFRRPSWKTFQTKITKSWLSTKLKNLLIFLKLKKMPFWSPQYFQSLLENQTKKKEQTGRTSEYVIRMVPTQNSRFIIWGDLAGAYHSVARCLQKLISLNVIDENLKLISPYDYLVFLGDATGRSPFVMELLTLIVKLEEKNPRNVFFIAGNNERRGSWYNYGLGEELHLKGKYLTANASELYRLVDHYFSTLPLGIYLSVPPHNTTSFVRLSHFALAIPSHEKYEDFVELLDDAYYSEELLQDRKTETQKIIRLRTIKRNRDTKPVTVKGIIKSTFKTVDYQVHHGLAQITPEKEAVAWTVLSCPTVIFSKILDFYNDAFTILQLAPQLNDWSIKLYYRDIRTKEDFKTKNYNFLTGAQLPANE